MDAQQQELVRALVIIARTDVFRIKKVLSKIIVVAKLFIIVHDVSTVASFAKCLVMSCDRVFFEKKMNNIIKWVYII